MHKPVKQLSTALLLAAALVAGPAAAERQELALLRDAVVAFVHAAHPAAANLEVEPDALDPRLRLAPCETPLEAFWAPGSAEVGQTTVGVRCEGARPWKLYVPTRVKLVRPVVVTARPLARGQRLDRDDLTLEPRDVSDVGADAVASPEQVLGYVVTRPVPAGRTLSGAVLQAPVLVERGRRVRMAVEGSGINITMSGLALESGAVGETVRVRNPASGRVVEGVVVGAGQVRLQLPAGFQKLSSLQ